LVISARSLAGYGKGLQALTDELGVVGVDEEAEQHQTAGGGPTDAVQEAQCVQDQVVACLVVVLLAKVVLGERGRERNKEERMGEKGVEVCKGERSGGEKTFRVEVFGGVFLRNEKLIGNFKSFVA